MKRRALLLLLVMRFRVVGVPAGVVLDDSLPQPEELVEPEGRA